MRQNKTQPLSEVIKDYIKALKIDKKLKEVEVIKSWEKVIGRNVAHATTQLYIKDKTLFVSLSSSVVRNELSMLKEEIIKRLNQSAGEDVIDKIVLK